MDTLISNTAARTKFAFLIHPRTNISEDMGEINRLLRFIPSSWYEKMLAKLPIKPWVHSKIVASDSGEVLGECICVPLSPGQLLGRNRKLVNARIEQAIKLAQSRGATLIGLGALTAPATSGGKKLEQHTDVGVTNGNGFTAAATVQAIKRVAAGFPTKPTIALVGATGSVGTAVSHKLAQDGVGSKLILIGRNTKKLDALVEQCSDVEAVAATSILACKEAQIVVLMTSAAEALLGSEHLAQGAIVIDDTQPRNTTPELLISRPDITLIDGGLVLTPGLTRTGHSIGIPSNISFACLAETALLALNGHKGHGVIGNPTAAQVNAIQDIADRNAHLGFYLAKPTSFGKPIDVPGWELEVA
jgi:predicted amino acid dehydrogenase